LQINTTIITFTMLLLIIIIYNTLVIKIDILLLIYDLYIVTMHWLVHLL